jgi:hypothetical protein
MNENQMPEGLSEFLELLNDYNKKVGALTLFSEIIQQVMKSDDPANMGDETLDAILNAIIAYGDRRVLEEMTK